MKRVLDSLTSQTSKSHNLLVIFDGPDGEYASIRNQIISLDFESVLFVKSTNMSLAQSIPDRRVNIANIHNQAKQLIGEADWVFSIEDDGVLPPDAMERLIKVAENNNNVGMVSGVELGRWGMPYVGAWRADDVNDIKVLQSVETSSGVEKIDACGLYCALIRADQYRNHQFFANNGLGPDVNLGLSLRRQGFDNYIDWGVPVTHLATINGVDTEIGADSEAKIVKLTLLYGSTWQVSR